jgi:ubiquitin-protein ligase
MAAAGSHITKRLHREVVAMRNQCQAELGVKIIVPFDAPSGLLAPWTAFLRGPPGTPYEGCVYAVKIEIGSQYPHSPPTLMFLNRCWHPNIGVNGHVCVDILRSQWSASLTVLKLLQSVQSMLDDPDPTSPLNGAAADMFRRGDRSAYRNAILACEKECYTLTEEQRTFRAGSGVLVESA